MIIHYLQFRIINKLQYSSGEYYCKKKIDMYLRIMMQMDKDSKNLRQWDCFKESHLKHWLFKLKEFKWYNLIQNIEH